MASTFATSTIEGVVSSVVEKLTNTISEEVRLLRGVRGEIEYIIDELKIMKAFLRSAEDQQDSDEVARTWVEQVRELAYDAEDCIDEFKLYLFRRSGHDDLSSALRSCFLLLSTLGARHRIATQIRDIQSKVKQASERRIRYHLTMTTQGLTSSSHVVSNFAPHDPRMTALFVEEKDLVGMDEPKRELICLLTEENKPQLGVISVVGMGGLGKTTLIRKVYESGILGHLFDCRVWITVSKFHVEDLLRDMIHQLQIPKESQLQIPENSQLQYKQLIEKLRKHLEDKKYLIVLDDIWTISTWDKIKLALPDSTNCSRVMVTTRIQTVAETCRFAFQVGYFYIVQPLSDERSWDLFCKRVFKDSGGRCPQELEDLSKAILKKCKGLPLTIVTIAGLLGSKRNKTREEWQRVNDRLGYKLVTNPNLEVVKQILNFSYNDLPHSLRPCFLYLSKYPEDYEIKRRQVVELWVAEGLATGTQAMSAEEVAEEYFDEFINRSMIQPLKIRWDGKVKSCTVHDVMLEVMISKSREQNLLVSSLGDEHEIASIISQHKIRRLSTNKRIEHTDLSHIRSITIFGHGNTSFVYSRSRLLRVLDLQGIWLSRQQLEQIGELIHLKYLSVDFLNRRRLLPKSWKNLHQLETLEIGETRRIRWAISLEDLFLSFYEQSIGFAKLQKLRHLRGRLSFLPQSGIGNLQSLQTLDSVDCEEGGGQVIEELGKLTQLRCLSLINLESEHMSILSTSLAKLSSCLHYLKMSTWKRFSFDCLESISSPPLQLQELKLVGDLLKLPSWVATLEDVAKITLHSTTLDDDAIQVLQKLPNLVHLKLKRYSFVSQKLCFVGEGFPKLKILLLEKFIWVRFKERAMPNLARLILPDISNSGAIFGIEHLVQLKELEVSSSRRADYVLDELLEAVKIHPNQLRVTIHK